MITTEIDRILRRNKTTRKIYRGCFPADMIPRFRQFPSAAVVNMDDSTLPGSHWVALYAPDKYRIFYFDSLGGDIPWLVQSYMRKNFHTVTQQFMQYQHPKTNVCGHYAIYFVYMCALRYPFERVLRYLHKRKQPDVYVFDFVNRFINK